MVTRTTTQPATAVSPPGSVSPAAPPGAIDTRRPLTTVGARYTQVDGGRIAGALQPGKGETPAPRTSRAAWVSRLSALDRRPWPSVLVAGLLILLCLITWVTDVRAGDEDCRAIDVTWYSPSGVAGCTLDGATAGIASWYPGDVAAANWCTWPWTDCGAVAVQSHATGLTITVPVAMFCDCWWTSDRRLVDLTEGQVLALGLDPADGTFDVTVTPIAQVGSAHLEFGPGAVSLGGAAPGFPGLPDTATAGPTSLGAWLWVPFSFGGLVVAVVGWSSREFTWGRRATFAGFGLCIAGVLIAAVVT
jgi:hypothetical protein